MVPSVRSPISSKLSTLVMFMAVAACSSARGQVRLFMAADGEQGSVATTGNTTVTMDQGTTQRIMVWLEDAVQTTDLNFYQVIIDWDATPRAGAEGTVSYVDRIGAAPEHDFPNAGALGEALASPARNESSKADEGVPPEGGACETASDCCDLDGDGIRDDTCMWCACVAGACEFTPIRYADMGGPFGDCEPDGFVNVHDVRHPIACFFGANSCDALNIDSGGRFSACPPEGFCNLSDSLDAVTVFIGTNNCVCPLVNPSQQGGDSIASDANRADFVFVGVGNVLNSSFHETPPTVPGAAAFGLLAGQLSIPVGTTVAGIRYLGEFEIEASLHATGDHVLSFVLQGNEPEGGTILAAPGLTNEYVVNEIQNLTVTVEVVAPLIVHATGQVGGTQPCSGYIDPRRESSDGVNANLGLQGVTLAFSTPVFSIGGGAVGPEDFVVTETGGGTAPLIASVDASANPVIQIEFSRPITPREWTTTRAIVEDASGVPIANMGDMGSQDEPDRLDVGMMPCDVDQDADCDSFDLLRFRQYINGVATPDCGILLDFVDIDRNGSVSPFDLLSFRQLVNGVQPATQPWAETSMNSVRP